MICRNNIDSMISQTSIFLCKKKTTVIFYITNSFFFFFFFFWFEKKNCFVISKIGPNNIKKNTLFFLFDSTNHFAISQNQECVYR